MFVCVTFSEASRVVKAKLSFGLAYWMLVAFFVGIIRKSFDLGLISCLVVRPVSIISPFARRVKALIINTLLPLSLELMMLIACSFADIDMYNAPSRIFVV